jgi:membrane-bound lytic murein transglycosylase B
MPRSAVVVGVVAMCVAALNVRPTSGPLSGVAHAFEPDLAWQDAPRPSFAEWLEGVRAEARTRGVRSEVIDQALSTIDEPLPVVIERDRAQAETVLSLEAYVSRRVTPTVVRTGRQMIARHRAVLGRVSEAYGVPMSIIVAIWGLESNFGRFVGLRPTVAALVTLAWDPRRSALFRGELLDALDILNRGEVEAARLRGSWAGAMGQPQFMPSSFLRYAVDFDGDGKRDIWNSQGDVFASVANYLKGYGWLTGRRWGREVVVPTEVTERIAGEIATRTGTCQARRSMSVALPLSEWQRLGVTLPGGDALPSGEFNASLVSGTSRRFLVYDNYDSLLAYNCAHAYAVSVALLAERLES